MNQFDRIEIATNPLEHPLEQMDFKGKEAFDSSLVLFNTVRIKLGSLIV